MTLGVGNAFSARHYSTCLAVEVDGVWLLIDCPHPLLKMCREAALSAGVPNPLEQFRAVVLTHLHGDHSSGLETYIFYLRYALSRKTQLLALPDVSAALWPGHLAGGMEWSISKAGERPARRRLEDFVELTPLSETAEVQVGPFAIRCRRTVHNIPTTALLIRGGGRCLGYSADTAYDPGLIAWLSEADLIVHETGSGGLHTPYADLAAQPAEVRSRLRLIHYADDFEVPAGGIEALAQGRCYAV
jgi:ribonuclease BN (tRNA processing enzyme)